MKKRFLGMLIAVSMILMLVPGGMTVLAESGTWGDNLTWTFENGVLTINGTGDMQEDYDMPWNNLSISEIIIGNGVTSIADEAFDFCGVQRVSLPNTLKSIGGSAFFYTRLEEVSIPPSVETIGDMAFQACSRLESVYLREGLVSIGFGAFSSCRLLGSIDIPSTVTTIGRNAFYTCQSLKSINVSSYNNNYASENGVLFSKDKADLIVYPAGNPSTSYTIPESVIFIESGAFYASTNLENIYVNANNSCYSQENGVLFDINKEILVYYPAGKSDESYSVPNSVVSIDDHAFSWSCLCEVEIPEGVQIIGNSAFSGCEELTEIVLPESITYISSLAFEGCINLVSVEILGNLDGIQYGTFLFCESLEKVILPDSITYIRMDAFLECRSLTEIDLPSSLETIGEEAFGFCTAFESITIPDSVMDIGGYAFAGCDSLNTLVIGSGVIHIGEYAFVDCPLTTIYYNGTEEEYNNINNEDWNLVGKEIIFIGSDEPDPDDKSFMVDHTKSYPGDTMVLALYNGNRLVDVMVKTYEGEPIPYTTDKEYTTAKVMIWNSLSDMAPWAPWEYAK
ncbi:MAG: leucine-rich repeat domain-containing protein [Ruminococcaceae bacterium]|nr:leucine-rich repeat domain-containing protein [Oscillospiraceae bacterium]